MFLTGCYRIVEVSYEKPLNDEKAIIGCGYGKIKEATAQARQLIETHKIQQEEGDVAYNFKDNNTINPINTGGINPINEAKNDRPNKHHAFFLFQSLIKSRNNFINQGKKA